MRFRRLHTWPPSIAAAIALQQRLRDRVRLEPIERKPALIAGADLAILPQARQLVAGIVLWDAQTRTVVESRVARVACRFPYVPGLLSFREIPGILAAARRLSVTPDAFMCDAQGLAHPRRFGLACHLGLWLGIPTLGAAKSRLCGDFEIPPDERGASSPLMLAGSPVGVVLRTRAAVRPIFVSPGHLCDIHSAARIVMLCTGRFRVPEPTRLAHQLVTREARR